MYTPHEVVAEARRIIEPERVQTAEPAEHGFQPWASFVTRGNLEAFAAKVDWIRENLHRSTR